jgi:hypothetical protein
MTVLEIVIIIISHLNGGVFAYIMWAPETPFKRAFMYGYTLEWLWNPKSWRVTKK